MGIASRLKRLELAAGIHVCKTCGGRGRNVISYLQEHDPVPPVEGCPECGKANHVLVRYVNEAPIRQRQSPCHDSIYG